MRDIWKTVVTGPVLFDTVRYAEKGMNDRMRAIFSTRLALVFSDAVIGTYP
jgi:hypothetical protein